MRRLFVAIMIFAVPFVMGWAAFAPAAQPVRALVADGEEFVLSIRESELAKQSRTRASLERIDTSEQEPPVTDEIYTDNYALLIGNDDYSGYPQLYEAINDVREVKNFLLTDLGWKKENVIVRENLSFSPGSDDDLKSVITEFLTNTANKPGARVFVWYSGHGEREGSTGYIIPTNTPTLNQNDAGFFVNALNLSDFEPMLRRSRARHIFMVFDSCFSGSIIERSRNGGKVNPTSPRIAKPARQFLTSGDSGEVVLDDGEFRRLFLDLLRSGEADLDGDGLITAGELSSKIHFQYPRVASQKQSPQWGRLRTVELKDGEFFFPCPTCQKRKTQKERYDALRADVDAWIDVEKSAQGEAAVASLDAYLEAFPEGVFAVIAANRIEVVLGRAVAPAISNLVGRLFGPNFSTAELSFIEQSGDHTDLTVFVDGLRRVPLGPVSGLDTTPDGKKVVHFELNPGETELRPYFSNQHGVTDRGKMPLRGRVSGELSSLARPSLRNKPNLRAVVVGIDDYVTSRLNLSGAVNDANGFSQLLDGQQRADNTGLYDEVFVTTLRNERATKSEILSALSQLRADANPTDTLILYFAGQMHFLEKETARKRGQKLVPVNESLSFEPFGGRESVLIPHDANLTELESTGIRPSEIEYFLLDTPGRKILFLDSSSSQGFGDINTESYGYVLFSGSSGDGHAMEVNGRGIFTTALLDGVQGEADISPRDGIVTVNELNSWSRFTVHQVSDGAQSPVTIMPSGMPEQPLFSTPNSAEFVTPR